MKETCATVTIVFNVYLNENLTPRQWKLHRLYCFRTFVTFVDSRIVELATSRNNVKSAF